MAGTTLIGGETAVVGDRPGVTGTPSEPEPLPTTARWSSVGAARFGMGVAAGVLAGGVVGLLTGLYGPALLVGFSLGLVVGTVAAETV